MLMIQELYSQQVRLQAAQEEARNESQKTNLAFLKVMNAAIEKSLTGNGGIVPISDNAGKGSDS